MKPKPLPKDDHRQMGPATFEASYRQDASGYVEAVFRFDTGKRRFTPAEFAAFRSALRSVRNEKPELLSFSSVTSEALVLGRSAEAVRLARGYAASQPARAAAQARLSRVLIATGAGNSALSAAKKAVDLDAKSTQAWQALGWAYQHDSFGRRFRGNWDSGEAVKAYRRATEADPSNPVPQLDLAIVYEHNADGQRYGKGSRLTDAVDVYRSLLKKGPNEVIQQNLTIALIYSGKYDDAKSELKKLSPGGMKSTLALVVRSATFVSAAVSLGLMRQYEPATELLKAAKRISNSPEVESRLQAASRMKRFDQIQYAKDDPRSVVQNFFIAMVSGTPDEEHLRPLFSKRVNLASTDGAEEKRIRRMLAALRGRFRSLGFVGDGTIDLVMSTLELEKLGDDALAYRISGTTGLKAFPALYVVKEDGNYRILATSNSLENAGKLVLDLVRSNQLASARQWLDLVINGAYVQPGQNASQASINVLDAGPSGDNSPAARFLWSGLTEKGRTANAVRTAAASLIGTYTASEEAIGILKQERQTATNRLDRGNIDLALCQAYAKAAKWTELLTAAKNLAATYAVAEKRFSYLVTARVGLKQWSELEQDARTHLKTSADNAPALRAAALAVMQAGKPERATEYIQRLSKLPFPGKEDNAITAWHALLTGKTDDKLVDRLDRQRAESMEPDLTYLSGFLQAQAGKPEEARSALAAALELEDWTLLDARPWALQGKIQERLGNVEAATMAYAEAKRLAAGAEEAAWLMQLISGAAEP